MTYVEVVNAVRSSRGHVEVSGTGRTKCGRKVWRSDLPAAYFHICRVCLPKVKAEKTNG